MRPISELCPLPLPDSVSLLVQAHALQVVQWRVAVGGFSGHSKWGADLVKAILGNVDKGQGVSSTVPGAKVQKK